MQDIAQQGPVLQERKTQSDDNLDNVDTDAATNAGDVNDGACSMLFVHLRNFNLV